MDGINVLEWVERLGGWGVVIWVVAYFMREMKADRQAHEKEIGRIVEGWSDVVRTFSQFEVEEKKAHAELIRRIDELPARIVQGVRGNL